MNTILHPLSLADTKCVCASFNPVSPDSFWSASNFSLWYKYFVKKSILEK